MFYIIFDWNTMIFVLNNKLLCHVLFLFTSPPLILSSIENVKLVWFRTMSFCRNWPNNNNNMLPFCNFAFYKEFLLRNCISANNQNHAYTLPFLENSPCFSALRWDLSQINLPQAIINVFKQTRTLKSSSVTDSIIFDS